MNTIHRQFESKAHEIRFRNKMLKEGYSPEFVDNTINQINKKQFFTDTRENLRQKAQKLKQNNNVDFISIKNKILGK